MLYFGDFDPSGEEMAVAMGTTLREEMGIEDLRIEKIALSLEDISRYHLPHDPRALKKSDTRAQKHVERFGELAVELDALSPAVLEEKIRSSIESELALDLFNWEKEKEAEEVEGLQELKARVGAMIEKKR